MSRVAKKPIALPKGVECKVANEAITVKGPKGTLQFAAPQGVEIGVQGSEVQLKAKDDGDTKMAGTARALLANMVKGVSEGYQRKLELVGVGYRAQKQGEDLVLTLGFSHPVRVRPPEGVAIEVADPTHFAVTGISKEKVGQVAADLRKLRPPEPYKGKGVMYRGERIRRKPGKSGKGAK